jgi:hypothetical protein
MKNARRFVHGHNIVRVRDFLENQGMDISGKSMKELDLVVSKMVFEKGIEFVGCVDRNSRERLAYKWELLFKIHGWEYTRNLSTEYDFLVKVGLTYARLTVNAFFEDRIEDVGFGYGVLTEDTSTSYINLSGGRFEFFSYYGFDEKDDDLVTVQKKFEKGRK